MWQWLKELFIDDDLSAIGQYAIYNYRMSKEPAVPGGKSPSYYLGEANGYRVSYQVLTGKSVTFEELIDLYGHVGLNPATMYPELLTSHHES